MARKKKKKREKRVATVDERGVLERNLTSMIIWTGIATLTVVILSFVQNRFQLF